MTGLVIKNLRGGGITPKSAIAFLLICAVAGVAAGTPGMFIVAISATCGGYVGSYLFQFSSGCGRVWSRLESLMPTKATYVELSRYIAHMIVYFITLVGIGIYSLGSHARGQWEENYSFAENVFFTIAFWSCLFLLFGGFFFIVMRLMRTQAMLIVGQFSGFAVTLSIIIASTTLVATLAEAFDSSWYLVIVPASVVVFVASYFVSLRLYKRRLRKWGA